MGEKEITGRTRIKVFIDYWNLQLGMNEREHLQKGLSPDKTQDTKVDLDWTVLGNQLAKKAAETAQCSDFSYEGMNVYTSYDPKAPSKAFHNWITNWMDKQPGARVKCLERRPRHAPRCSDCHELIAKCPKCSNVMKGTVEKGVDTLIVTDIIRLAWEGSYDIAVLASMDADFIPAVEFIEQKGLKVIQAGYPPKGMNLAKKCWGSFDLYLMKKVLERKAKAAKAKK